MAAVMHGMYSVYFPPVSVCTPCNLPAPAVRNLRCSFVACIGPMPLFQGGNFEAIPAALWRCKRRLLLVWQQTSDVAAGALVIFTTKFTLVAEHCQILGFWTLLRAPLGLGL
jgi:hypothetical protein